MMQRLVSSAWSFSERNFSMRCESSPMAASIYALPKPVIQSRPVKKEPAPFPALRKLTPNRLNSIPTSIFQLKLSKQESRLSKAPRWMLQESNILKRQMVAVSSMTSTPTPISASLSDKHSVLTPSNESLIF